MASIGIFGAGYVGLVTGACFAELGHDVVVRDVVPERIDALRRGEVPIYEPGLEELLERNSERLDFTLDVGEAVAGAEFLYICVGTPPTYSGDADLSAVWTVIDELQATATAPRAVAVMKSTVPVGTGEKVRAALDAWGLEHVGYASNPEFTAEGTAVRDFMHPDRVVVGSFEEADGDSVAALHAGIDAQVVRMDVASAEMVKLASNAFLMTRISFINEIANVCEATGADVVKVAEAVGLDRRLGPHFLRAGIGYGGSCLEGSESVLVREAGLTRLTTLEKLFEELAEDADAELIEPQDLEVLSWRPSAATAEFLRVTALTRRPYSGELYEVVPEDGKGVRCTPDHPFVTHDVGRAAIVKLASDLTLDDFVPSVPMSMLERQHAVERQPVLVGGEGRDGAERLKHSGLRRAADLTVRWIPVRQIVRRLGDASVYSLEVPESGTFVTTGGLVVHNCFPKDSLALKQLAANSGYHFQLLNAVIEVNELQKRRVIAKLEKHLGKLRGKRVAVLGLAFKPHTDDMREAPSLVLASRLLAEGAEVRCWDPVADATGLLKGFVRSDTPLEAADDADAVVIVTEWPELRGLDLEELKAVMRTPVLVDGRNFLEPDAVRAAGLVYEGIGRMGQSSFAALPETSEPAAPDLTS